MIDINKEIEHSKKDLGKEIGVSKWVRLNQKSISEFSNLTEDPNFIHTKKFEEVVG